MFYFIIYYYLYYCYYYLLSLYVAQAYGALAQKVKLCWGGMQGKKGAELVQMYIAKVQVTDFFSKKEVKIIFSKGFFYTRKSLTYILPQQTTT